MLLAAEQTVAAPANLAERQAPAVDAEAVAGPPGDGAPMSGPVLRPLPAANSGQRPAGGDGAAASTGAFLMPAAGGTAASFAGGDGDGRDPNDQASGPVPDEDTEPQAEPA
jgi:hypothetical protein